MLHMTSRMMFSLMITCGISPPVRMIYRIIFNKKKSIWNIIISYPGSLHIWCIVSYHIWCIIHYIHIKPNSYGCSVVAGRWRWGSIDGLRTLTVTHVWGKGWPINYIVPSFIFTSWCTRSGPTSSSWSTGLCGWTDRQTAHQSQYKKLLYLKNIHVPSSPSIHSHIPRSMI